MPRTSLTDLASAGPRFVDMVRPRVRAADLVVAPEELDPDLATLEKHDCPTLAGHSHAGRGASSPELVQLAHNVCANRTRSRCRKPAGGARAAEQEITKAGQADPAGPLSPCRSAAPPVPPRRRIRHLPSGPGAHLVCGRGGSGRQRRLHQGGQTFESYGVFPPAELAAALCPVSHCLRTACRRGFPP
jgi:hypothetical protein